MFQFKNSENHAYRLVKTRGGGSFLKYDAVDPYWFSSPVNSVPMKTLFFFPLALGRNS